MTHIGQLYGTAHQISHSRNEGKGLLLNCSKTGHALNPPSCDHFGNHGAYNFSAGDLFCKEVSLNQKRWLPNGDQAKILTWRVGSNFLSFQHNAE